MSNTNNFFKVKGNTFKETNCYFYFVLLPTVTQRQEFAPLGANP